MLLKYFYDQALAHASYLVGCQKSGEALVIDPGRDIEPYLEMAKKEGLRIVAAAETHIHADYVSGMRELADRIGAKLYVSDTGPADWKYQYAHDYPHQLLIDGSKFTLGKLEFETLATPGHTPESISFLLTDKGGGANRPIGIFTGDFVFVGSIGRPDLLEEAAGVVGSADSGARDLFRSIGRFRSLPDYLQVWPAHGAGSACGKGLGAIPSSTVGYEKMFNPALQFNDEQSFVKYILSEQPEAPKYFAVMKRVNKVGPAILGASQVVPRLALDAFRSLPAGTQIVDTNPSDKFSMGHLPGSLNLPHKFVAAWGGWLIDYSRPVVLITSSSQVAETARVLHKIGVDSIEGYFEADEVAHSGLGQETYSSATPQEISERVARGEVLLVDVRGQTEWDDGHIEQARHLFLGRLPQSLKTLPTDKPILVQCRSGARSAVGASVLQAAGIKNVINLSGGIMAWTDAGLPVANDQCAVTFCG